jgi:beta-glucosidase
MSEQKPKKRGGAGRIVARVTGAVLAVVFIALIVAANAILPNYTQVINSYLGVEQGWDNSGVNTEGLDLEYSKADHKSREDLAAYEEELDKQIAAEGIVLLENDDASLPLAEGTTLSFVSGNSRSLGTGSAGILASTMGVEGETVDAVTPAMEAAGLKVNQTLVEFYASGAGSEYVMGPGSVSYGDDEDFSINECPLSVMREAGVLDSLQGTTPVFVMKRVAGEGRAPCTTTPRTPRTRRAPTSSPTRRSLRFCNT